MYIFWFKLTSISLHCLLGSQYAYQDLGWAALSRAPTLEHVLLFSVQWEFSIHLLLLEGQLLKLGSGSSSVLSCTSDSENCKLLYVGTFFNTWKSESCWNVWWWAMPFVRHWLGGPIKNLTLNMTLVFLGFNLFLFSYLSASIYLNLCFMFKIFKLGEQNILASLQKEKNCVLTLFTCLQFRKLQQTNY